MDDVAVSGMESALRSDAWEESIGLVWSWRSSRFEFGVQPPGFFC